MRLCALMRTILCDFIQLCVMSYDIVAKMIRFCILSDVILCDVIRHCMTSFDMVFREKLLYGFGQRRLGIRLRVLDKEV